MAQQIILTEDCNLGPAGTVVWVNDPSDVDIKAADASGGNAPTVAELREQADGLGVDHKGLKKADLVDAIAAKQAEIAAAEAAKG